MNKFIPFFEGGAAKLIDEKKLQERLQGAPRAAQNDLEQASNPPYDVSDTTSPLKAYRATE